EHEHPLVARLTDEDRTHADRSPRDVTGVNARALDGAGRGSIRVGRVLYLLLLCAVGFTVWRVWTRTRNVERQVRELRLLRREIEEVRTAIDRGLTVTRGHLAAVVAGESPTRGAILRGPP